MISNYSSLIELFSAIYITMAVEYRYFREIWNPTTNNAVADILREAEGTDSRDDHIELIKCNIEGLHSSLAIRTNRRGALMVGVCVFLLIFIGYENELQSINCYKTYLSLDIALLFICLVMLFSKYILTKLKGVVFFIVVMVVLFWIIFFSDNKYLNDGEFVFIDEITPIIVVSTVIIPVIYHLLVNWMFHGVYQGYLKQAMTNAITEYNNAYRGKNANPVEYEDVDISDIKETLLSEISRICRPGIVTLTVSLVKYYIHSFLIGGVKKLQDTINAFTKLVTEDRTKAKSVNEYVKKKKK